MWLVVVGKITSINILLYGLIITETEHDAVKQLITLISFVYL